MQPVVAYENYDDMKTLSFLFFLIFLSGIALYGQPPNCSKKTLADFYNLNDSLLNIWRNDKYGCSQERVMVKELLFEKKALIIGMPKKAFLALFGEPEERSGEEDILTYYIVAKCDENNKPQSGTWGLEIDVWFVDEEVYSIETIILN